MELECTLAVSMLADVARLTAEIDEINLFELAPATFQPAKELAAP